jgi:hypothetical protein
VKVFNGCITDINIWKAPTVEGICNDAEILEGNKGWDSAHNE